MTHRKKEFPLACQGLPQNSASCPIPHPRALLISLDAIPQDPTTECTASSSRKVLLHVENVLRVSKVEVIGRLKTVTSNCRRRGPSDLSSSASATT
ncbi:hypothetical protein M404DRAFT_1001663, partial [Pisolithus tinctorius Marx 270]